MRVRQKLRLTAVIVVAAGLWFTADVGRGGSPTVETLQKQARTATSRGNYERAIDRFERALDRQPNNPELRAGLGWAAFQAGAFDRAVAENRRAVKATDKKKLLGVAWYNIGRAAAARGQWTEAVDAYETSLQHRPDRTVVKSRLEWARQRLGARDVPRQSCSFTAFDGELERTGEAVCRAHGRERGLSEAKQCRALVDERSGVLAEFGEAAVIPFRTPGEVHLALVGDKRWWVTDLMRVTLEPSAFLTEKIEFESARRPEEGASNGPRLILRTKVTSRWNNTGGGKQPTGPDDLAKSSSTVTEAESLLEWTDDGVQWVASYPVRFSTRKTVRLPNEEGESATATTRDAGANGVEWRDDYVEMTDIENTPPLYPAGPYSFGAAPQRCPLKIYDGGVEEPVLD